MAPLTLMLIKKDVANNGEACDDFSFGVKDGWPLLPTINTLSTLFLVIISFLSVKCEGSTHTFVLPLLTVPIILTSNHEILLLSPPPRYYFCCCISF